MGSLFLGMCVQGLKRTGNELPEEKRNKILKIVLESQDAYSSENISFYFVCCAVRTKTPQTSDFSHEFILVYVHYDVNQKQID